LGTLIDRLSGRGKGKVLTMFTIRTLKVALGIAMLLLGAACSREQQDWRSAEAADSIEAYENFVQRHPDSELSTQARARVTQLGEDRDWQQAGSADTAVAYRQFITQHPNGKWTQEARIRIENFSLAAQPADRGGSAKAKSSAVTPDVSAGKSGSGSADPDAATPAAKTAPAIGTGAAATAPPAVASPPVSPPAGPPAAATPPVQAVVAGSQSPAAASPATGSAGGFGIQLGAFGSEAAANSEWQALSGRYSELKGLSPHIVAAQAGSARVFRLQAAVGDEARARSLCTSLKQRSQACIPVAPRS
jgi:SPOR domain